MCCNIILRAFKPVCFSNLKFCDKSSLMLCLTLFGNSSILQVLFYNFSKILLKHPLEKLFYFLSCSLTFEIQKVWGFYYLY